jgi:hypothetical protein
LSFGYGALEAHLHSLFWWMASVLLVYSLLDSILSNRAALLGAAVFAVAPAHTIPLLWLANRNVLITQAFCAIALTQHFRWRGGWTTRRGLVLTLLWTATLLTGEYALGCLAYALALEVCRRGEPLRVRLAFVGTALVPAAIYLAIRSMLGYGVHGSGIYTGLSDGLRAISGAPRALAVLVGAEWLGLDDVSSMSRSLAPLIALEAASLGVVAVVLWRGLRREDAARRSNVLALALGSVVALAPAVLARPSIRVLGVGAIGVAAVVGTVVDMAWEEVDRARHGARRLSRGVVLIGLALVLGVIHLVAIPLAAYKFTRVAAEEEPAFEHRLDWMRERLDQSRSTVVVLRTVTPPSAFMTPFMLRERAPARFRALTQTGSRIVVQRNGPRELEIHPRDGGPLLMFGRTDPLRSDSFATGQRIDVPGLTVTVLATDEVGEPTSLRYEFDRDLDDPTFWWLIEGPAGFREAPHLLVGQELLVQP